MCLTLYGLGPYIAFESSGSSLRLSPLSITGYTEKAITFHTMKKGLMLWNDDDDEDEDSSEESSSSSDSNADKKTKKRKSKKPIARFAKKDKKEFDYESLQKHGYKAAGLPENPVAPEEKQDWSWNTGKDKQKAEEVKESYREREATRAAVAGGQTIENALLPSDRKNLSFSQKEKKKRDLGQASRGKNYVEEEKRQLRESGVYSGFDS